MEHIDIQKYVAEAKRGSKNAFGEIYNSCYNEIYYFVLRNVSKTDIAFDITQDTFMLAYQNISDLKKEDSFLPWIKSIAYHECIRYYKAKKEKYEKTASIDEFVEIEDDETLSSPSVTYEQAELRQIILGIINSLSFEQGSAIMMYYYEEMDLSLIAEIQGVSVGTVKSRLNYGRKKIKKAVEEYENKTSTKIHGFVLAPFIKSIYENVSSPGADIINEIKEKSFNNVSNSEAGGKKQAYDTYSKRKIRRRRTLIAGLIVIICMAACVVIIMKNKNESSSDSLSSESEHTSTETIAEKITDTETDSTAEPRIFEIK